MLIIRIIAVIIGIAFSSAAQASEPIVDDEVAKLGDAPAIQFETSGWSYTNTSNPFLLTPDFLTNAMLGVSRLKSGESFLSDGPKIPSDLNPKTIQSILAERLKHKSGAQIDSEVIGNHKVAIAKYDEGDQQCVEYAFEMRGYLIHVLLIAKRGAYFDAGARVARKVVTSIEPL